MSSKYIRPGVLNGMIGYQYNPARLTSGTKTWLTSTGQLLPLYDGNFEPGEVGHNASYMRLVEAYQLKKQIDPMNGSLIPFMIALSSLGMSVLRLGITSLA